MFNPISLLVGIVKSILFAAGFGECKVITKLYKLFLGQILG